MRDYITRSDIAVIGGGPAGAATALLLARLGYGVTLVDRARFPRDKVCGDFLTPGAVQRLRDEIGVLPELVSGGARIVSQERVVTHGGRWVSEAVDGAMSCPRAITDRIILDAARRAGVTVIEGCAVRSICLDACRVVGFEAHVDDGRRIAIKARVIVGADGTHSLLARTLDLVRPIPRLQRAAMSAYATGVIRCDDAAVTMYLPQDRSDACCGVGPAAGPNGCYNVNMVVPVSEASSIAGRVGDYFSERLSRSFPAVQEQLGPGAKAANVRTTGCFGHRTRRASADGALLVGDAATFIHPFTGEGVFFALEGARLAANAIDWALRKGDTSRTALVRYDIDRQRHLAPRYRLCDVVQSVAHSPVALSLAASAMRSIPAFSQWVFTALSDIGPVVSPSHRHIFTKSTTKLVGHF